MLTLVSWHTLATDYINSMTQSLMWDLIEPTFKLHPPLARSCTFYFNVYQTLEDLKRRECDEMIADGLLSMCLQFLTIYAAIY